MKGLKSPLLPRPNAQHFQAVDRSWIGTFRGSPEALDRETQSQ